MGCSQHHGVCAAKSRWTRIRWTRIRWTRIRWTRIRWTRFRWTRIRWTLVDPHLVCRQEDLDRSWLLPVSLSPESSSG